MGYMNADNVLPEYLVKKIQKYVDGQIIYILRKGENSLSWGEKSGARDKLAKRNREIVSRYYMGESVSDLSAAYYLSEKRIQGIIHTHESSGQGDNRGGFINE
ncbi:MAG: CD3324 family protein [Clostridium sp.]|nr:CD3324 family protein [Clostridium sp.]